ncbi:PSMC3 [Symbiodinium sp. CCMP2592]|nr:PSMC3 [Symbiodinium sp. CCMP2592]
MPGAIAAQVASATGLPTPLLEWRFDDAQIASSNSSAGLDWIGSSTARGSGSGILRLGSEPTGHHLELLSVDFTSLWVDGRAGGAISFDGSAWGSRHPRDLFSASALGLPVQEITVAAWINVDSFVDKGGIVSFVQFDSEVSAGWSLFVSSAGQAHFILATEFSGSDLFRHEVNWLASPSFSTQTWQHVVGTYDGCLARLFWDGVEVDNRSVAYLNGYTQMSSKMPTTRTVGFDTWTLCFPSVLSSTTTTRCTSGDFWTRCRSIPGPWSHRRYGSST